MSSSAPSSSHYSIHPKIRQWTAPLPEPIDTPAHTLIQARVEQHPQAEAIVSWDKRLTYAELGTFSLRVARHLISVGVAPECIVLIALEKSAWVVIFMLAVLKAGGVFVLLDVTQPAARLQTIARQTKPVLAILSSDSLRKVVPFGDNLPILVFEDATTIEALSGSEAEDRYPTLQPHNAAYIFFTSGSTGTPKGVIVEHGQLSSSCTYSGQQLGFANQPAPRVLQLTSYAFDPCILEIITTLVHGGTVCIPSAWDAKNRIAGTIRQMNVTCVVLTPTLLSSLSHLLTGSLPPSLKTMIIGGEMIKSELVEKWAARLRLLLVYGPTECCVLCFFFEASSWGDKINNGEIGRPLGARAWIVKVDNFHELTMPGECGELLIEGPLVARGYLGDSELTRQKFVDAPKWMQSHDPDAKPNEQRPRLYRTGDLAMYQDDGSICCMGRIDNQVKIRGQRVELGEVERQLSRCLAEVDHYKCSHVIVETITLSDSRNAHLVAFMCLADPYRDSTSALPLQGAGKLTDRQSTSDGRRRLSMLVCSIDTALKLALPASAIPSLYIPITQIPLAISGKTDRMALRGLIAALSFRDLSVFSANPILDTSTTTRKQLTDSEKRLRTLWAQVLDIEPLSIRATDNFFSLGGDSVLAIRMVATGRSMHIGLSFETIFRYPDFDQMARAMEGISAEGNSPTEPESPQSARDNKSLAVLRKEASRQCQTSLESVQDVYPCSPLQTSLVAASLKDPRAYMMQVTYQLPSSICMNQLRVAWERVYSRTPVTRSRFIDHHSTLLQAVIDEPLRWNCTNSDLPTVLAEEKQRIVTLGGPMSWFTVSKKEDCSGDCFLIWTIHHSLMDGWTASRLEDLVELDYLHQNSLPVELPSPRFASFIQHIQQQDNAMALQFWTSYLKDAPTPSFSPYRDSKYNPCATETLEYVCRRRGNHLPTDITAATWVLAAWSLLVSIYSDSFDVLIDLTLNGRTVPLRDIQLICGPTISTVPFRSYLDPGMTVEKLLRTTQEGCLDLLPFAQYGPKRVQRENVTAGAATACIPRTILVIQPDHDEVAEPGVSTTQKILRNRHQTFSSVDCGLMMECIPDHTGRVSFRATFDANCLEYADIQRIFNQFEHLLEQISSIECSNTKLSDLQKLSEADREQIFRWNSPSKLPDTVHSCVHELIQQRAGNQPDAPALCAWDGDMTYGNLEEYASRLALYLQQRYGIGVDSLVAICFEKSKWTVVAMLAVLKAGAVCVPLDPTHPTDRLRTIIQELGDAFSGLMLTSRLHQDQVKCLDVRGFVVCPKSMTALSNAIVLAASVDHNSVAATPGNAAFIIFTSGSTGLPKGIVLEHRAFCSSALAHGAFIQLGVQSRVLQFAAYTVDICLGDIFATLIHGGCICIPSEHDRMNKLSAAMEIMKVNHANLTPTVASQIQPQDVSTLKVLVAAGEMLTRHVVEQWTKHVKLINMYGPAECSVYCVGNANITIETLGTNIGKGVGASIWIADPEDVNRIVPIGAVGELIIEGPGVARGYLGHEELTNVAFIEKPVWATSREARSPNIAQGGNKFYKTGDLGMYNSDGSISLVGRRSDYQAKLYGQRFELGEVEYNFRQSLPITVVSKIDIAISLVRTLGADKEVLAAFFAVRNSKSREHPGRQCQIVTSSQDLIRVDKMMDAVETRMSSFLPAFMVPSLYIPISGLPLTASGKVDRRTLRALVSVHTLDHLSGMGKRDAKQLHQAPSSKMEMTIRDLWKTILHVNRDIGLSDDFFRLGGDSVLAMRLVSLARRQGIILTVDRIFKNRRLIDLALAAIDAHEGSTNACAESPVAPFSLLPQLEVASLRRIAAEQCGVQVDSILDIYPCTAFQERWMLGGERTPIEARYFQGQAVFEVPLQLDLERFCVAWNNAIRRHELLRTRLIETPSGFLQVVVDEQVGEWRYSSEPLQEYLEKDRLEHMDFGCRLLRLAMLEPKDMDEQKRYFIFTAQHAIYDGVSLNIIFEEIEEAYFQMGRSNVTSPSPLVEMRDFIKYLMRESHGTASLDFWTKHLSGAVTGPIFGNLRPEDYKMPNQIHRSIKIDVPDLKHDSFSSHPLSSGRSTSENLITLPTIIQVAIGLVFAHHSGRSDVILRMTRAGRSCGADVPGVEYLVGPVATVVPVRVHLDPTQSALDLLITAQYFQEDLVEHEHLSMLVLQRMAAFQLVLHHTLHVNIMSQAAIGEGEGGGLGARMGLRMVHSWMRLMGSYGVIVEIEPGQKRFELRIASDPGFVAVEDVLTKLEDIRRVILALFEVGSRLEKDQLATVGDIVSVCQGAK
jgi:amino acid adenylation domain-containing protein